MARYFKITDKTGPKPRTKYVDAPVGSQLLFCEIDEIVGPAVNSFGFPHCLEVDGWGEFACIGETYEEDAFDVECITEEEYRENL